MLWISNGNETTMSRSYLVFLVNRPHSFLTFRLRDNFPCVLHDDLVGFECAVAANTVSTV